MTAPDFVALAAEQLNGRRAMLLAELVKVEKAIAALSEVSDPHAIPLDTGPPADHAAVPGADGRFAKKGLRDSTKALLAENDLVTVPEIVKALRDGGFRTKSQHLNTNVHTTLRRLIADGEAEKVGGAYRKVTK